MMKPPIYFITSNKGKFLEARSIVPGLEQLSIDLPEIQHIDARAVIKAKLEKAFELADMPDSSGFVVEDTSLYMDCLNGLPGPLIKWFIKALGNEGLSGIAERLGNDRARATTIVGYARNLHDIHYFEGSVSGRVVRPRGSNGFGWDAIFQPDGFRKTFAEMSMEEKNSMSMRKQAFKKLADFLASQSRP